MLHHERPGQRLVSLACSLFPAASSVVLSDLELCGFVRSYRDFTKRKRGVIHLTMVTLNGVRHNAHFNAVVQSEICIGEEIGALRLA